MSFCLYLDLPVLSRMMALSLGLKRASVLLRMNSTTTDWMRTSMNAAVPLKQADSICLDLKHSYSTSQPISQPWTTETCPSSLSQKHQMETGFFVANGATLTVCMEPHRKSDSSRVT